MNNDVTKTISQYILVDLNVDSAKCFRFCDGIRLPADSVALKDYFHGLSRGGKVLRQAMGISGSDGSQV